MLASSLLTLGMLSQAHVAYAGTTITLDSTGCSTIGGTWSSGSPGTFVCALYSDYTVNAGDVLNVPSPVYLYVFGHLRVDGTLNNYYIIENEYVLLDYGTINNFQIISNQCTGTITNFGSLVSTNGIIVLYGSCNINNVSYEGTFTNSGFGTITNIGGPIYNFGTFHNLGTIYDTCGGTFVSEAGSTYTGADPIDQACTTSSTTTATTTATTTTTASVPEFSYGTLALAAAAFALLHLQRKRLVPQT